MDREPKASFVNALIEPRSATESIPAALARAKALVERRELDSAAVLFFEVLDTDLSLPLRAEVQTNLGAALCTLAAAQPGPTATVWLVQARELLTAAASFRRTQAAPAAWATTQANLALVHLARYKTSRNTDDLMLANLALDEVDQALDRVPGTDLRDWIAAIRTEMTRLRAQQSKRR